MAEAAPLFLDPSIRDWVLFPITLVMILVGLLRHYVTLLLNSPPKKQPAAIVREQRALLRAQLLRASAPLSPLPPAQYASLSGALTASMAAGEHLRPAPSADDAAAGDAGGNPMMDPGQMEGMMDGMKKQAVMMVPNMVIMQWINLFFSGFVLIKLPFPLTYGFKAMLQRDIAAPDMDVRYVSALSWYFLNLFGLNGVFRLILGGDMTPDGPRDQSAIAVVSGASAVPTSGPGAPDMPKLFKAEVDNLALAEGMYRWAGGGVEERVLKLYGRARESRKDR